MARVLSLSMAQPSQPGASPQRPAGTPVPPGPCTSEVSWPSCPAGWHLHTRTRMADGEGVTAEPTCPESASLCSANSLGVRQGTYRDQGLLGVRHQGCDRDVGWHKHSRHLRYPKPLVSHTANGSGARGCAGAGGWNKSSEVSLGHRGLHLWGSWLLWGPLAWDGQGGVSPWLLCPGP